MKPLNGANWQLWQPASRMHDFITDYSNCDESWTLWYPRVGGAYIYRYGAHFAVVVFRNGTSHSRSPFDHLNAALLFCTLSIEQMRSHSYRCRIDANRRARNRPRILAKIAQLRAQL